MTAERRNLFLSALVGGATVTEASIMAGIDRTTGQRWLREPGLQAELTERRAEIRNGVASAAIAAGSRALAITKLALEIVEKSLAQSRDFDDAVTALGKLAPILGRLLPGDLIAGPSGGVGALVDTAIEQILAEHPGLGSDRERQLLRASGRLVDQDLDPDPDSDPEGDTDD